MEGIRIGLNGDRIEIRLAGRFGVSHARHIRRELETAIGRGRPIDFDGTEITALDTAAVQVLVLFYLTARAKGLEMHWRAAGHALEQAAALLGVSAVLGLTESPDVTRH